MTEMKKGMNENVCKFCGKPRTELDDMNVAGNAFKICKFCSEAMTSRLNAPAKEKAADQPLAEPGEFL